MSDTVNPFALAAEALRYYDETGSYDPGIPDALALLERLAAVEVEVKQTSPTAVVCQAYWDDDGVTRAYGQRVVRNHKGWTVSLQPAGHAEAGMVAMAHAAQECRRRNALATERAEADETGVRG